MTLVPLQGAAQPMTPHSSAAARSALWRLHGLAAMLATPFLLAAALTGLVYVPTPQVEAWQHGHLDQVQAQPWLSLDNLVARAQAAAPEGQVMRQVSPPLAPGDTLRVQFAPAPTGRHGASHQGEHTNHGPGGQAAPAEPRTVFMNPSTGAVLGVQTEAERFNAWAKRLHSALLQGSGWRWLIEWAATCLLVMLITGVALAWPKSGHSLLPRAGVRGRAAWRQWHILLGLLLAALSAVIVLTGLTWSQTAGAQIRALRDATGQAPPRAPQDLRSLPGASADQAIGPHLGWDTVWALARQQAPDIRLLITPPKGNDGVWRISTADRSQPTRRQELALHAYTGQVLWRSGWADQTAFGKATAIGIPFHRGEFGLWNQALLALFGLGVLASTVSGWVMWWRRSRSSSRSSWLGFVRQGTWAQVPWRWPALVAGAALCTLIPLLTAFLLIFLLLEWAMAQTPTTSLTS